MGLINPKSGKTYVYRTLPIGTLNSPGTSGRFGAAFIFLVMDTSEFVTGTPVDISLQQYFTKKIYHPTLGESRVLKLDLTVFQWFLSGFTWMTS